MKFYFMRFHRWVSLVFALPLLIVIGTGLVLSFEPMAISLAQKPGSLTAERLNALLARHDPDSKARGLVARPYEGAIALMGEQRGSAVVIDVASGEAKDASGAASALFGVSRGLHEHFLFDQRWILLASTFAMLAIIALGVLMGLPRLSATLSGWHKGMAWFGLPLLILSPLTGLMLYYDISLGANLSRPADGAGMTLRQAVQVVGAERDPSTLIWVRRLGGVMAARVNESGSFNVHAIGRSGLSASERQNWPRLLHEGDWQGAFSGFLNVLTSFAMLGLLGTGFAIWLRRTLRRRSQSARPVAR